MSNSPTTELDIARAIAAGELPSPTEFQNSQFYKMRVSGTGVAWRNAHREFCFRPPAVWLSDRMIERVRGLPVIAEHPPFRATLDGPAFHERVLGICVLGFVEGSDLMAVVRVIDKQVAAILDECSVDTSPCVQFDPSQNTILKVGDDDLLVEGEPILLDHLALVTKGVWNRAKDGADVGVEITAEEELENA